MKLINRENLVEHRLSGRIIQKSVGKDGFSPSQKMTMGFGHYSSESGPMDPHHHAEEIVYIMSAEKGWFRYRDKKTILEKKLY